MEEKDLFFTIEFEHDEPHDYSNVDNIKTFHKTIDRRFCFISDKNNKFYVSADDILELKSDYLNLIVKKKGDVTIKTNFEESILMRILLIGIRKIKPTEYFNKIRKIEDLYNHAHILNLFGCDEILKYLNKHNIKNIINTNKQQLTTEDIINIPPILKLNREIYQMILKEFIDRNNNWKNYEMLDKETLIEILYLKNNN